MGGKVGKKVEGNQEMDELGGWRMCFVVLRDDLTMTFDDLFSLSLVDRLEWIMLFDDDANVGFFLRYFVEEVRYIYLLLLIAIIMQLSDD